MSDTKKKKNKKKKASAQSRLRKMIDFSDDHPVKKRRERLKNVLKMMDS